MKRVLTWKRVIICLLLLVAGQQAWSYFRNIDSIFWPASAHDRIENMAAILRRIQAPARWCIPSNHVLNLAPHGFGEIDKVFDACVASIKPAGDFIEADKNFYIKRFYRARQNDYICEITLSTVWDEDRIVGSDCYYGLFRRTDDKGVGMTDDYFG